MPVFITILTSWSGLHVIDSTTLHSCIAMRGGARIWLRTTYRRTWAARAQQKHVSFRALSNCGKSFAACRAAVASVRAQAHPHQAVHPTHQRQGRAFHPDGIARMGIRRQLPKFRRKSQRVVLLAPGMRLLLESLRVTKQTGNRPDQAGSEQRLATPQLDGSPHVGGVSGQNGDYSTCYQRDCASLECCSVLRMSQRVARGEHWTA